MAVFLGHNSTIAVDASRFPGTVIKANHIYFTDDNWEFYYFEGPKEGGGRDSGVYSLETGTVEPIDPGEVLCSRVSPSTWLTPCGLLHVPAKQLTTLADLPYDNLAEIAKKLKKLEDFTSFRSVSKSLRAAAKEEYFEGLRLRQRTPYLMLPVRDDGNDDDTRELYSLVEGESIMASVKVAKFKNKKCLESLGWLMASEEDGTMSLVDPFSGTEIPLPHQHTFPGYETIGMDEHVFFEKMVLSARPSETSDFILMVIAGGLGHLGFWRLGDKEWNRIEGHGRGRYCDVVYHGGGQFYGFKNPGAVWLFKFRISRIAVSVSCRAACPCRVSVQHR